MIIKGDLISVVIALRSNCAGNGGHCCAIPGGTYVNAGSLLEIGVGLRPVEIGEVGGGGVSSVPADVSGHVDAPEDCMDLPVGESVDSQVDHGAAPGHEEEAAEGISALAVGFGVGTVLEILNIQLVLSLSTHFYN